MIKRLTLALATTLKSGIFLALSKEAIMPKMIEVPVFTIGELSQNARDKAYYGWYSVAKYECSDNISTIESFCDLFNVKLVDWEVCEYRYDYSVEIPQQRNITKKQAIAMVNSWEITQGYFLASVACDAIKEDWQHGDIKLAIDTAVDNMFKAYQSDIEYLNSIECFVESCEANDWTFLESGELFNV